jgi:hypothetical protein
MRVHIDELNLLNISMQSQLALCLDFCNAEREIVNSLSNIRKRVGVRIVIAQLPQNPCTLRYCLASLDLQFKNNKEEIYTKQGSKKSSRPLCRDLTKGTADQKLMMHNIVERRSRRCLSKST